MCSASFTAVHRFVCFEAPAAVAGAAALAEKARRAQLKADRLRSKAHAISESTLLLHQPWRLGACG
jgi:hypothetical protein